MAGLVPGIRNLLVFPLKTWMAGTSPAMTMSRRACAWNPPMARITAFLRKSFRVDRRCRSSVVEHSLGKGEVVSSILPGSTSFFLNHQSGLRVRCCTPIESNHLVK
jgi:hypothetical protein